MKFKVGHLYENPGCAANEYGPGPAEERGGLQFIVTEAHRVPKRDDLDGKAYLLGRLIIKSWDEPDMPHMRQELDLHWTGFYRHVKKVW